MPRLPQFATPGSYIRYNGAQIGFPDLTEHRAGPFFIRLGPRESPLKYQWVFSGVAAGQVASQKTFGDFQLEPNHIAQVFIGVSYGGRLRVFHPNDTRILKWDDPTLDIQEKDTGNIEYTDSPVESPRYEIWIAPTENYVPGIDAENVLTDVVPRRSIDIQVYFLAAKYRFEFVEPSREADLHSKLTKFQIPSRPVTFGGKI